MNRIILIGNGFDLAHGLKTSYSDFITYIWERKIDYIIESQSFNDPDNDVEFIEPTYNHGFFRYDKLRGLRYNQFKEYIRNPYGIKIKFNNKFLEHITESCCFNNWVDVEKEYYELLKELIKPTEIEEIDQLNLSFEKIKSYLIEYLLSIENNENIIENLNLKIYEDFKIRDFSELFLKQYIDEKIEILDKFSEESLLKPEEDKLILEYMRKCQWPLNNRVFIELIESGKADFFVSDLKPEHLLFLNFNYTSTSKIYYEKNTSKVNTKEIHIHGDIHVKNQPIIFGFGDELDENYTLIENLDDNRFLENIKSTGYHETNNYKLLLEFINSSPFQIFIFGHSCGLSDRTLLNTIFEHKNCISIKPFYYVNEKGEDNYSDIVRNISRHFRDKASLRDKVVNKTYCTQLCESSVNKPIENSVF